MVEKYIKLLESFKQNMISKLIERINAKIFAALKSPYVSPRIAPYFEKINVTGVPFTDYDLDPDNISQIKKLINALYYAQLTFVDLESIDVRNLSRSVADLQLLYSETINKAYEASYLATHLDVNLKDMFSEELAILLPLLSKIQDFAENHAEKTKEIKEALKAYPLSYKAGEVTGIVVDQMRPLGDDVDYNFLIQFSAVLPSYLDQLTQHIQKYSTDIIEHNPKLNKEKLDELKNAALHLINDVENLKGNSLFVSLKFLNYIHIIRNIITLSMSSLEQMGELNDKWQNLICDKLALLKYTILPTLFDLVDKIEDNAMLEAGTLSRPLMKKIKVLYQTLIYLPSKVVDFKAKGEELLSIEDSRFIELRLEPTYKRIDAANKALFKIEKAQEAVDTFFSILNDPLYNNLCLYQLPLEKIEQLIQHYKIIKPYMTKLDIDFNEQIITSLLAASQDQTWNSYVTNTWKWARGQLPAHQVSLVLQKKEALQKLIAKDKASQLFHIGLNKDLIESVHEEADLALFPYNEKTNIFTIDELSALHIAENNKKNLQLSEKNENKFILNTEKLTADQALDLYLYYKNKRNKFIITRNAYNEFISLLKGQVEKKSQIHDKILHLKNLDDDVKVKCRNLYNVFQPYFVDAAPPELKADVLDFDKYLVAILSNKEISINEAPSIQTLLQLDNHFQNFYKNIDAEWDKNGTKYLKLAKEKYIQENAEAKLEHDTIVDNRAHYLIQHTKYSKSINEFREALLEVNKLFNKSMQAELKPQPSKIPYPEVEDPNKILAQSQQVIAIKQIFNALYHIQGIVLELEKLNNKSAKSVYVYHLLQAYGHINEIIKLSKYLSEDPHFGLIARELLDKAQTIYATFMEHSDPYQVAADQVPYGDEVQYNALWYALNAFYVIPKHIRSIVNTSYLTAKELEELNLKAKKATLFIKTLINNSDSYFKLFLQTRKMIDYYEELSNKLNEFTGTTHDAVLNNLHQIRAEVFTPMLLEADQWEEKLGLVPGRFSGPLKKITDEYFKGLLHPLDLDSKTHIALVCDETPLVKRKEQVEFIVDSADSNLKKINNEYKGIETLYQCMLDYKALTGKMLKPSDDKLSTCEINLRDAYTKALPKLITLIKTKKVCIKPSLDPDDHKLDALCNLENNESQPKLTEIEALITASYHYYLGVQATHQMTVNTAQEKLTYLKKLSAAKKEEDLCFIEEYTTESFDKHLGAFCNRHIGLQFTDKEYRNKLKNYLLTFKAKIIQESKNAEDINHNIEKLLKEKISLFEKENYAKFYHLDAVKSAIFQFKIYFYHSTVAIQNNNSLFESNKTLDVKSKWINALDEIADTQLECGLLKMSSDPSLLSFEKIEFSIQNKNTLILSRGKLYFADSRKRTITQIEINDSNQNDFNTLKTKFTQSYQLASDNELQLITSLGCSPQLSIEERIERIKNQVKDPNFTRVIHAHKQTKTFSFTYLKLCFVSLLEALHLYTPDRKKLFNNIKDAVNNQPKIDVLTKRFGLFSAKTNTPEIPKYHAPDIKNYRANVVINHGT